MKIIITFITAVLFALAADAQNIVPNFSFEEDDSCPTFFNTNSYEYSLGCIGWGQATSAWADYFNACDTATISVGATTPWAGVPNNFIGHQFAFEGNAYTGINLYSVPHPNYKAYLITGIPPLEIDSAYQVTIHVCLASYCEFATDGMGVLFTTYGSPSPYGDTTIRIEPQIDYTSYGVITDSVNWTTLTGTFISDSTYTSLIIGGFKSVNEMHILTVNDSASNPHNNSFYYIDNIVVEKLSSTGFSALNKNAGVNVYPNPFTDHVTMTFDNQNNQCCTLTIFNAHALAVQQISTWADRITIERDGLPPGFYYYQLRGGNNLLANGKLVIR